MPYTQTAFDDALDEVSASKGNAQASRELLTGEEFDSAGLAGENERGEDTPCARETFDDWFGADDRIETSAPARIGSSPDDEYTQELYVYDEPLSRALHHPEDIQYYREQFLPTLLREGRAAWPGERAAEGSVSDGAVVERTPDGFRVIFGRRVAEPLSAIPSPESDGSWQLNEESAAEPPLTEMTLDNLL